jgi:hypothetical protein
MTMGLEPDGMSIFGTSALKMGPNWTLAYDFPTISSVFLSL